MRRFSTYLGIALAACLSCFSLSVLAEPVEFVYRALVAVFELPGVAYKRMELTLVQWRTEGQSPDESLKSNLRASSNHLVMTSTKPEPDGIGVSTGLSYC